MTSTRHRSKVWFVHPQSAWQKMRRILNQTKIKERIEKDEIVAVKMHFGEMGNVRYIHPSLAREIVDAVKEAGGRPLLTDTSTLYRYARQSLFDYLQTAAKHGFTSETMGCPTIIADGLRGTSGQWVEIARPHRLKRVKVAQAVFESDFLIVLSHLTLHGTGLAGAVKNVAMGCTTKETKLAMHASEAKPTYNKSKCTLCLNCVRICPSEAFYRNEKRQVEYDPEKCIGCGECVAHCESGAIAVPYEAMRIQDQHIGHMDGFAGVISTFSSEKQFYVNVAMDVTSHCDCAEESDIPMVPDLGILASYDPIACDKASFDMLTQAVAYPGSEMEKQRIGKGDDKVRAAYPKVDMSRYWRLCQESELGSVDYELEVLDGAGS